MKSSIITIVLILSFGLGRLTAQITTGDTTIVNDNKGSGNEKKEDAIKYVVSDPGLNYLWQPIKTNNSPTARENSIYWTDSDNNLWLWGGSGKDKNGRGGLLDDLWEYNSTTNLWEKIAGNAEINNDYSKSSATSPAGRILAASWVDAANNLWIFGGQSLGSGVYFNDMWKFEVSTKRWIPIKTLAGINQATNRGNLNKSQSSNNPGSRAGMSFWTDANGKFWLLGGMVKSLEKGKVSELSNDLWSYSPVDNQWTWEGGSDKFGKKAKSDKAKGNQESPSPRINSSIWQNKTKNLVYLYGGYGLINTDSEVDSIPGQLADLWILDNSKLKWEEAMIDGKINKKRKSYIPGQYSIKSSPGKRFKPYTWIDTDGNLKLYGGQMTYSGGLFMENQLWTFNTTSKVWKNEILKYEPGLIAGGATVFLPSKRAILMLAEKEADKNNNSLIYLNKIWQCNY